MSGKSKQVPFTIVEIVPADSPDHARRAAAYQVMMRIASRILVEGNAKTPPE